MDTAEKMAEKNRLQQKYDSMVHFKKYAEKECQTHLLNQLPVCNEMIKEIEKECEKIKQKINDTK
jgi:hypothetical protein